MTLSDSLPEPLVSSDVDLRGFSGFMLDVDRLLASELIALGKPEEICAALMLWCRAWKQTPPASLPDDDRILAAFSGTGRNWSKVKALALRGFIKCSDGRLYHKVLAQEAKEAWDRRLQHIEVVEAKTTRQQRWRERIKAASEQLRVMGIVPPRGASLETLERLLVDGGVRLQETSTVDASGDGHAYSVDGAEIGKTGTGTGTGTKKERKQDAADAAQSVGNATNGHVAARNPEADLFRRGKELLGETSGGLIKKLLVAKNNNVALARAAIEQASTKENAREYIGRIVAGRDNEQRREDERGDKWW